MNRCVALIAGKLGRDFLEHALPQRVALLHRVALVGHADLGQPRGRRVCERVTHDPVHALVGVDLFLDRHLVGRAGLEAAADADVHALGVLAKHDEVDVRAATILQRRQPIVQQADRTVVDVEIELEAGAEQDVARVAIVGHARIAERTDEDRVELVAQHAIAAWRERLAGCEKVVRAPRQMHEVD